MHFWQRHGGYCIASIIYSVELPLPPSPFYLPFLPSFSMGVQNQVNHVEREITALRKQKKKEKENFQLCIYSYIYV